MDKLFTILFLLFYVNICSQNMIKNPSFEEVHDNYVFKSYYVSINPDSLKFKYWYVPNNSTPDLFINGKIDKNININVNQYLPDNNISNSFIGLCLFRWDGFQEQITGNIEQPLKEDSIYELKISISSMGNYNFLSLNTIGIRFSESKRIYSTSSPYYPEMIKERNIEDVRLDISNLCGTQKWVDFSTYYRAKGGERYLTIGMFYDPQNDLSDLIRKYRIAWPKGKKNKDRFFKRFKKNGIITTNENYIPNNFSNVEQAYYFIDNVQLVPIPENLKDYTE